MGHSMHYGGGGQGWLVRPRPDAGWPDGPKRGAGWVRPNGVSARRLPDWGTGDSPPYPLRRQHIEGNTLHLGKRTSGLVRSVKPREATPFTRSADS